MAKLLKRQDSPDLSKPFSPILLGQAITARRTQSGLKLEDAAALAGVAKQTLMKIEHGNPNVSFNNILRVMSSLGISLTISPWKEEVGDEWH